MSGLNILPYHLPKTEDVILLGLIIDEFYSYTFQPQPTYFRTLKLHQLKNDSCVLGVDYVGTCKGWSALPPRADFRSLMFVRPSDSQACDAARSDLPPCLNRF